MTIKEIYEAFDKIGCLSFTTVNQENQPVSRIAHLRAYDHQGIYFMTMFTKDFYKHIKLNGNISLCGLNANPQVSHDENGLPLFEGGYSIRMTGKVSEISINDIKEKNNPIFDVCLKDHEKYPAMVVLCITEGTGDLFDYDFETTTRENKLQRSYFSYPSCNFNYKGLHINQDSCISCGLCKEKCSFLAITEENSQYKIDKYRCDECGDCLLHCPVQAISHDSP